MNNNKIRGAACGGYWCNRAYSRESNLIITSRQILAGKTSQPFFCATTTIDNASGCRATSPNEKQERQLAGITNSLIGRWGRCFHAPTNSFMAGISQPSGQRKPELDNKRALALILFSSPFFGATKTDWRGY